MYEDTIMDDQMTVKVTIVMTLYDGIADSLVAMVIWEFGFLLVTNFIVSRMIRTGGKINFLWNIPKVGSRIVEKPLHSRDGSLLRENVP